MPCAIHVWTNNRRPVFCFKWTQRSVLLLLYYYYYYYWTLFKANAAIADFDRSIDYFNYFYALLNLLWPVLVMSDGSTYCFSPNYCASHVIIQVHFFDITFLCKRKLNLFSHMFWLCRYAHTVQLSRYLKTNHSHLIRYPGFPPILRY